ncbi:MAG: VOC family protein [Ilumatobacteraceae bacterium]
MITWLTAFVDLPEETFDETSSFWASVTGWSRSPPRGARGEFGSLVPSDGDPLLKVQRLAGGAARLHLDVHVDDRPAAVRSATGLGAAIVADRGHTVLESPGGLVFCIVDHAVTGVRPQQFDAGGGPALVDQFCIDAAPDRYETEASFWAVFTGWPRVHHGRTEYEHIIGDRMPLRLLMQRRDEGEGEPVAAHLDIACGANIDAIAARHLELGATLDHVDDTWTTLRDPAGLPYCLVRREPSAG